MTGEEGEGRPSLAVLMLTTMTGRMHPRRRSLSIRCHASMRWAAVLRAHALGGEHFPRWLGRGCDTKTTAGRGRRHSQSTMAKTERREVQVPAQGVRDIRVRCRLDCRPFVRRRHYFHCSPLLGAWERAGCVLAGVSRSILSPPRGVGSCPSEVCARRRPERSGLSERSHERFRLVRHPQPGALRFLLLLPAWLATRAR